MYAEADVYVYPTELWSFIRENASSLKTTNYIIAEYPRYDVEILLTQNEDVPEIYAMIDGKMTDSSKLLHTKEDAIIECRRFYGLYLKAPASTKADQNDDVAVLFDQSDREKEVTDRDDELFVAMTDFLNVVIGDEAFDLEDQEVEAVLDDVLAVISADGYDVYRPCFFTGEDGSEYYEEFPYTATAVGTADEN